MVQRRDLNAPPGRRIAEAVRSVRDEARSSKTVAHGHKHMGTTGDASWTDPETGEDWSVRVIPPRLEEYRVALGEAQAAIDVAKQAIADERADREAALADALAALSELEGSLTPLPGEVADLASALATAQEVASGAQEVADAAALAADAANQAALAAAGIAAAKGRVIYSDTRPGPEDESAANLWVKPADASTWVWDAAAGDWLEVEDADIRAAAQNAAEAAAAAAVAQATAEAAKSNAAKAQTTAEAAQRTADQATLDARDAHNAAVEAQERVAAAIASGESLVLNGSFEDGDIGWPAGGSHGGRSRIIEDDDARTGSHVLELTPTNVNVYPESDPIRVEPGRVLYVRGWFKHLGGDGTMVRLLARTLNSAGRSTSTPTVTTRNPQTFETGEWILLEGDWTVPEGAAFARFSFYANGPTTSTYHCDDMVVLDVTEARAAQARADAAYGLAESRPDQAAVDKAAKAAQDAAQKAAAADAAQKAAQAKVDAVAQAGSEADRKDAAIALAAANDAKAKADRALAAARADLAAARTQITAEIKASANGKNAIRVAATAPSASTPGIVAGDVWWQVDAAGVVFAQWRWTPLPVGWVPVQVRSEVIANLDVSKLVVTGQGRFAAAVVDRLFADLFVAHKITAEQVTIAALAPDGTLKPGSVGAITLQNGIVGADQIIASEVAAEVSDLVRARVENLTVTDGALIDSAVILALASEMITAGVLRTADAGQRVVIDGNGLTMFGVDPDGVDYEMVRLGPSGENLLTIGGTTIAPDSVSSSSGAFDILTVDGEDVLSRIRDDRGLVAWAQSTQESAWHGTTDEVYRLQVNADLEAGRIYQVTVAPHYLLSRETETYVMERVRWEERSTSGAVTPSSRGISSRRFRVYPAPVHSDGAHEALLDTSGWNGPKSVWLMLTTESAGQDVRYVNRHDYPLSMWVRDLGPSIPESGRDWASAGTSRGTQQAAPSKPEVTTQTYTWASGGFGGDVSSGQVVQGTYRGVGERWGGWVFPSEMLSTLRKAKSITRFQVYLYAEHWYYGAGGTAVIRPNDGTYKGTGFGNTLVASSRWPRRAGRWVTLPSSWFPYFMNGTYKGISVKQSSSSLEQYGRFNATATRFKVTYTI